MTRKAPKRAGEEKAAVTAERLEELAVMVIDPTFELGPLDREDLREALCETMRLRSFNRSTNPQPQEAAA